MPKNGRLKNGWFPCGSPSKLGIEAAQNVEVDLPVG